MASQKNNSQKYCNKCKDILTVKNWNNYDKKSSNYICFTCRKKQDKKRYVKNKAYSKKQLDRYYRYKSAVINAYGDSCLKCGEDEYGKLTMNINGYLIYNYLFNNVIQKDGYYVFCYNCYYNEKSKYKDKYCLIAKKKIIKYCGGKCSQCKEHRIKCLMINCNKKRCPKNYSGYRLYRFIIEKDFPKYFKINIICYNCYYNNMYILKGDINI